MSTLPDVSGTGDGFGKGKMPKGYKACTYVTWAWREQRHDCHRKMECYLIYML